MGSAKVSHTWFFGHFLNKILPQKALKILRSYVFKWKTTLHQGGGASDIITTVMSHGKGRGLKPAKKGHGFFWMAPYNRLIKSAKKVYSIIWMAEWCLTMSKFIVKIDSRTWSFCLCHYVQNGLSYSGKETRPKLCIKWRQAKIWRPRSWTQ